MKKDGKSLPAIFDSSSEVSSDSISTDEDVRVEETKHAQEEKEEGKEVTLTQAQIDR